jgi:hypothetical protein
MPSRATTQIARETQKPSACWSSARAGGVPSVLIAPTSQGNAVDSPSDEPTLDRHVCHQAAIAGRTSAPRACSQLSSRVFPQLLH